MSGRESPDDECFGARAYLAAANGDAERLKTIVTKEGAITYTDEYTGMMPIHIAASWGNPECIEILMKMGCDINTPDSMKCTPLHHAARNGHNETVKWLIDNGAEIFTNNIFGQKPADMALCNHFPELSDIIQREGKRRARLHEQGQKPSVEKRNQENAP